MLNLVSKLESTYRVSDFHLGLFRIFYCLYVLIICMPNFLWISDNPDIFFNPKLFSIAFLFSHLPGRMFFGGLDVIVVVSLISLLFGYRARFSSLVLAGTLIMGYSFAYSFGKIDHYFIVWLIPLLFSFSRWDKRVSVVEDESENGYELRTSWSLILLALLIGFAMLTAGLPKLLGGWLDIHTQAVRGHFFREYFVNDRKAMLAPVLMNIQSNFFWEVLDYSGVFFEIGFFFTAFNRKLLQWYLIIAVCFHVMNYLMLNILFIENYIAYAAFIGSRNWEKLITKVGIIPRMLRFRNYLICLMGYGIIYYLCLRWLPMPEVTKISPLYLLLPPSFRVEGFLIMGVLVSVGSLVIVAVCARQFVISDRADSAEVPLRHAQPEKE